MPIASATALAPLQTLLRQLRDIKGVQEKQPGVFTLRGTAFANFHDEQGALLAELRKPGGSGYDRYPLATPTTQRKFIDDAKRRASRGDDD
ncbi:MAG: hypothetical protein OEY03_04625 [Rhizobacter sp.]|nr:hypothetical protein [Rhizobacter sp.]